MGRKRYIHTDMSTEPKLIKLGNEHGDFAVLFFTMLIPHANDGSFLKGCPEQIMYSMFPGRTNVTPDLVSDTLTHLLDAGLLESWDRENDIVYLHPSVFYKYQKYVKNGKQRKAQETAENYEKRNSPQEVAEKCASLSPSPSPSPSKSKPKPPKAKPTPAAGFDEFWDHYPKRVKRQDAVKAWNRAVEIAEADHIIAKLKEYRFDTRDGGRYIAHASTWLNGERWEDEDIPFSEEPERELEAWYTPDGKKVML